MMVAISGQAAPDQLHGHTWDLLRDQNGLRYVILGGTAPAEAAADGCPGDVAFVQRQPRSSSA